MYTVAPLQLMASRPLAAFGNETYELQHVTWKRCSL
jgi:hypothetical protein